MHWVNCTGEAQRLAADNAASHCSAARLAAIAAPALCVLALTPAAQAACTISGSGTQTALNSGDAISCTGAGNTKIGSTAGATGVSVVIGDGTTTTSVMNSGIGAAILFDQTTSSAIEIANQATVAAADSTTLRLQSGSN